MVCPGLGDKIKHREKHNTLALEIDFTRVGLFALSEIIMAVLVKESDTLADIDEALSNVVETLKQATDREQFMTTVNALLDARLEKR